MSRSLVICVLCVLAKSTCFGMYVGQHEQDKFVNENYFKGQKNGVFVDVGAYDGRAYSNTYFFEKELEWTGICVEPLPNVFTQLKKNRNCLCIEGCVSNKEGKQKFLQVSGYADMLSGLVDQYDPRHRARIQGEISKFGGSSKEIIVQTYNINRLLEANKIDRVNFLSIDTEGGEFDIIAGIDFDRFVIDVIIVEDNYGDNRFIPFLAKKGFQFTGRIMNQDLIFVRSEFLKDNCALKEPAPKQTSRPPKF